MSKSEGNFYTLRDLLLKGHRASAIRFLLISVPYRNQMNFTFEGLEAAANAVDRLRTFQRRVQIVADLLQAGFDDSDTPFEPSLPMAIAKARENFTAALANDLNTAEAIAAIFELVRAGNAAGDSGRLRSTVAKTILEVLDLFEGIFAVLEDRDAELTRAALLWAKTDGRMDQAAPELVARMGLTDDEIERLVAARTQAKKTRNFAQADAIRMELTAKGILLEDSRDGVRWKRR